VTSAWRLRPRAHGGGRNGAKIAHSASAEPDDVAEAQIVEEGKQFVVAEAR